MRHLVLEDVLQLLVGPGEGKDDSLLEEIGDPARSLAWLFAAQRIGLLKVGLGGIENDGLALLVLMAENPGEALVRAFRKPSGIEGGGPRLRIEIDIEVLGAEHLEVEAAVLDFVLAEVVLGRKNRRCPGDESKNEGGTTHHENTCRFRRRA